MSRQVVREKKIENRLKQPYVSIESNNRISKISTADIKAFCTPDIMSCHPLIETLHHLESGYQM